MKTLVVRWLCAALFLLFAPGSAFAAFGLTSAGGFYTVDTDAGLVFKVNQTNGDITSLVYNGVEYQYSAKGSHINSGLGTGTTVSGTTVGTDFVKITLTDSTGTLTHYLMARRGFSHIYMATLFTQEPSIGLVRFIVRIPNTLLPNGPAPSDIRNNTGAIESADIFGMADGTTRSKHYSNHRLIDWSYTGATGTNVAAWMVHDNQEGGSGGPFFRCLINQCGDQQELYEIVNYGEGQTEAFRLNVLNGPYTLVFTNGGAPPALDTSWFGSMGLLGYIAPAGRGAVTCAGISGRDTSYAYTVGFANATAQGWTGAAAADGAFAKMDLLPGTYTMSIYKNELAVYTASVGVTAGGTTILSPIAITADPSATVPLWRIGNWDGTPNEFLNADRVTFMHPSDTRISTWEPGPYVVGTSTPATGMPCYQWKAIAGGSQTIQFTLNSGQIATSTVKVGITCANAGARPNIAVNSWTAGLQGASIQPSSRTLTVGTYRGNNVTYTFTVPASALAVGTNSLYLYPISGSSSTAPYLSPGYSLDCVELYQGTAQTLAVPAPPAGVTASGADSRVSLGWSAVNGASSYNVLRAAVSGGPYTTVASSLTAITFTDTGLSNGTTYYYAVSATNSSGTGPPSDEASGMAVPPTPPVAPTGLSAVPYNTSATLTWNAAFTATSYNLKRSKTSGSGYVTVKNVTTLTYSDFGLANGTTYYYVVSAINVAGEGVNSAPVSVTPSSGTTVTLTSTAALDGYITASSSANTAGGTVTSTGVVRTGDSGGGGSSGNRQYKGIFSFDTSSLPDDATIQSATLKLKRSALSGTTPFTALGTCYADIKGGTGFNGSTALESADFQATADATQVATMSNAASTGAISTGVLNGTGLGLLNRTGTTQFRVYFSTATNSNNTGDYISWYAGDDTTDANRPVLEVTYGVGTAPTSLPIAYLPFNETSGTVAADATGNGWSGTLVNGPAWVAGRVNNALSLSAANQYATVTMPTGVFSSLTDFSIATWVNLNSVTNWARVFDFGTGTTNYLFLTPTNGTTGKVRFAIRSTSVAEQIIEGTGPLPGGTWTHVAVTLSGTTGKLYVNGALAGSNTAMTLKPSSLGNTTLNYLGKSQFAADPNLSGRVDEFQIYNHALTPAEVALLAAPPAAPAGLAAAVGDGQATLSWSAVSGTVTGYNVKRATAAGGPFTTIASGVPNTAYTDLSLVNGTTYQYVVSALNGVAEGPDTSPVSVTPLAVPAGLGATTFNGAVTMSWNAATGATGYNVKRSTGGGGAYTPIASALVATNYRDATAVPGTAYSYVISAVNATGESANSTPVAIVASPTAPAGLTAVPGNAVVALRWNAATGAANYNVLRSETSGTGYSELAAGITATSFSDTSAVNGVTYYYVVSAENAGGESAWSTQTSAQPTSPISPQELRPPPITMANGIATCTVRSSVPGHSYQLQHCGDLASGAWENYGAPQAGNGGDIHILVPVAATELRQFYRITIIQQ